MPWAPNSRQRAANAATSGKLRPRELRNSAILLMLTESLVIAGYCGKTGQQETQSTQRARRWTGDSLVKALLRVLCALCVESTFYAVRFFSPAIQASICS